MLIKHSNVLKNSTPTIIKNVNEPFPTQIHNVLCTMYYVLKYIIACKLL